MMADPELSEPDIVDAERARLFALIGRLTSSVPDRDLLRGLAGLGDKNVVSARAAGLGLATPPGAGRGVISLDAYVADTQRAFAAAWTDADTDFREIRGSCCELLLC
jgi:hypothetical protein